MAAPDKKKALCQKQNAFVFMKNIVIEICVPVNTLKEESKGKIVLFLIQIFI